MERLILASASPRRREICEKLGLAFDVVPALGEEPPDPKLPLPAAVTRVAKSKAGEVAARYPGRLVLGADTVVAAPDGTVLGKPRDKEDACRMLALLSGRRHRVVTGVWLCGPGIGDGFADETAVEFMPLDSTEIRAYVDTGEPLDKAGAYAIQGQGMRFVRGIAGDFYTVMGLPGARLWAFPKPYLLNLS